jgi:hypothetical protein
MCDCYSSSYDKYCSQGFGTIAFIGASYKKKAPGEHCPVREKDEAVIGVYIPFLALVVLGVAYTIKNGINPAGYLADFSADKLLPDLILLIDKPSII